MPKKQLIIPCYCNHCQHLSFLTREESTGQYRMMDFIGETWTQHACAQIHPETVERLVKQHRCDNLAPEPELIPFQYQGESTARRREPLTVGIIVKLVRSDDKQTAEVITPHNQFLNIRVVDPTRSLHAGKALNLKKAIKVGKGKYRLEKAELLTPDRKSSTLKKRSDPFYHLLLNAKDQEKLETFVNRLLAICKKARTLPANILLLPIVKSDNEQIFNREIRLPLNSDLLLQIEKLTIPESIQISVHHD